MRDDKTERWLTTAEKAEEERLSVTQVRRRARGGKYPGADQPSPGSEWRFPPREAHVGPPRASTASEIAAEEERKQTVLAHFEDLRYMADRWRSEVWLPVPWRWDIADLKQVFYADGMGGRTGYKLPDELVDGEESGGHFRQFDRGRVHWRIDESANVTLRLPVEDEAAIQLLQEHTAESPAWSLFDRWKRSGGEYVKYCSMLLARINDNIRGPDTEAGLRSWVIFHDAFCVKDTEQRCGTCGAENTSQRRFCRGCHLLLGWLQPILAEPDPPMEDTGRAPIHIRGWGNLEESVEAGDRESIVRASYALLDKYQGHDLVYTILDREKEVREVEAQLGEAVDSLSQRVSFTGQCDQCSV